MRPECNSLFRTAREGFPSYPKPFPGLVKKGAIGTQIQRIMSLIPSLEKQSLLLNDRGLLQIAFSATRPVIVVIVGALQDTFGSTSNLSSPST
jgi:hypothetical protein